jgi:hypothetical protein
MQVSTNRDQPLSTTERQILPNRGLDRAATTFGHVLFPPSLSDNSWIWFLLWDRFVLGVKKLNSQLSQQRPTWQTSTHKPFSCTVEAGLAFFSGNYAYTRASQVACPGPILFSVVLTASQCFPIQHEYDGCLLWGYCRRKVTRIRPLSVHLYKAFALATRKR